MRNDKINSFDRYLPYILNGLAMVGILFSVVAVFLEKIYDWQYFNEQGKSIIKIILGFFLPAILLFVHSCLSCNSKYKLRGNIFVPVLLEVALVFILCSECFMDYISAGDIFYYLIQATMLIMLAIYSFSKNTRANKTFCISLSVVTIISIIFNSVEIIDIIPVYSDVMPSSIFGFIALAPFVISLILIIVSVLGKIVPKTKKPAYFQMPYANINANHKQEPEDNAKKIEKLVTYKKLLDDNAITQEEFDKIKKDLLK